MFLGNYLIFYIIDILESPLKLKLNFYSFVQQLFLPLSEENHGWPGTLAQTCRTPPHFHSMCLKTQCMSTIPNSVASLRCSLSPLTRLGQPVMPVWWQNHRKYLSRKSNLWRLPLVQVVSRVVLPI